MKATEKDIQQLNSLYEGRRVFWGDLHNHAATGGTSDGSRSLEHWKGGLEALGMDFVAILDHRQVRHMYLPEWEDGTFISGTEPGGFITDSDADFKQIHYNMIFPHVKDLEALLESHPEFQFEGGPEGHFKYPNFSTEEICKLIDDVKALGGFFVHPHPKQNMKSENPLSFWFRDETGLEVFYDDMRHEWSEENYKLWCDLLALGKRLWACAGEDRHSFARDTALTTIYAEEKKGASYIKHLRLGDFVCGSAGIKMCMGDMQMGGMCDFEGKRCVIATGDFHRSVKNPEHTYRLDVISDRGVEFSEEIPCTEPAYFAFDAEDRKFYRTEITDVNQSLRIAIGNPIWNEKYYN